MSKTIEDTYVKLSPIEHVLKKPGMYVGDLDFRSEKQFVYLDNKIIEKEINWSPGLYKIVDELIVNSYDQSLRDETLENISVDINTDSFTIFNDGIGIDVVKHPTHQIYIPELIFGNLLTSTNYNENEQRITGGTHGLGAKLSAIFSKKFTIEVWDSKRFLYYSQTFESNLSKINKPKIEKYDKNKGGVKISIEPDFEKFKTNSFSSDMINLLKRRVVDLIGLTKKDIKINLNSKQIQRSNDFESDPNVRTGSATDRDYKGSGYDRGHLAPAADMSSSANTMQESFYYSNMSPQDPSFNRGIWKKLEELVRDWAVDYKSVYVVTGPVLSDGLPTIGPNQVSVPKYYYKVILDHHEHPKAIAFILPNQGSKESLTRYVVSIDELEKITGIDFFPGLVDKEENALEKEVCIACWSWTTSSTGSRSHHSSNNVGTSSQCMGTTKKGARCKRMTKDASGYCYQHD